MAKAAEALICGKCQLPRDSCDFRQDTLTSRFDGAPYLYRCSICKQCEAADSQVVRHRKYGRLPDEFEFPYREWGMRVDATGHVCPMCKEPNMRMCIDHITPFHDGGGLELDNLQPVCLGCNTRKWHRVEKLARRKNGKKGGRPKGSKDKKPRNPR